MSLKRINNRVVANSRFTITKMGEKNYIMVDKLCGFKVVGRANTIKELEAQAEQLRELSVKSLYTNFADLARAVVKK